MGENFQFRLRAPSFSSYFFPASKSNKNTFNNVFLMFTILQWDISNSQLKFDCQLSSYKSDTELMILHVCYVYKTPVMFIVYILNFQV